MYAVQGTESHHSEFTISYRAASLEVQLFCWAEHGSKYLSPKSLVLCLPRHEIALSQPPKMSKSPLFFWKTRKANAQVIHMCYTITILPLHYGSSPKVLDTTDLNEGQGHWIFRLFQPFESTGNYKHPKFVFSWNYFIHIWKSERNLFINTKMLVSIKGVLVLFPMIEEISFSAFEKPWRRWKVTYWPSYPQPRSWKRLLEVVCNGRRV